MAAHEQADVGAREDQLTDLARSIEEPLAAFHRWVNDNWERVEAARRDWDHRAGRA